MNDVNSDKSRANLLISVAITLLILCQLNTDYLLLNVVYFKLKSHALVKNCLFKYVADIKRPELKNVFLILLTYILVINKRNMISQKY